ncbi:MAG: PDR/VanB family oxidoreductase [Marmoricola sp.]
MTNVDAGVAPSNDRRDLTLVVRERAEAANGVVALTLVDPRGDDLPSWNPGSHIDVSVGDAQVRQYSLCSSPSDRGEWRIAVLAEPASRGGSAFIHEHVREGVELRVRGPRNNFQLVTAPSYRFIAGGIGITPILPMIETVSLSGASWRLLYGGRTRESMAFLEELSAYGDHVDVVPQDEFGLLDLDGFLGKADDRTRIYCCGPQALLEAVEQRCHAWPDGALSIERFSASARTGGSPQNDPVNFDVVCRRSGITVTVPSGVSIFDALTDEGIDIDSSCLEGTCGTCETSVLEGVPDHRDHILTGNDRESSQTMYVCVSRALSRRLVLDI